MKYRFAVDYNQFQSIIERGWMTGTFEAESEEEARKQLVELLDSYERYSIDDLSNHIRDEELLDTEAPEFDFETLEIVAENE